MSSASGGLHPHQGFASGSPLWLRPQSPVMSFGPLAEGLDPPLASLAVPSGPLGVFSSLIVYRYHIMLPLL